MSKTYRRTVDDVDPRARINRRARRAVRLEKGSGMVPTR